MGSSGQMHNQMGGQGMMNQGGGMNSDMGSLDANSN